MDSWFVNGNHANAIKLKQTCVILEGKCIHKKNGGNLMLQNIVCLNNSLPVDGIFRCILNETLPKVPAWLMRPITS